MFPFTPAWNEYRAIVDGLRGVDQRIKADAKGVFSEALILFDHVPVHRTATYGGYDGYEIAGNDLRFALTGDHNARRPYYVSNKEANISLADSEVVTLDRAWRWMTDWKSNRALERDQILQQRQAWRENREASVMHWRMLEHERRNSVLVPPPPQVWGTEQDRAWQAETERLEAAADKSLSVWDGHPYSVTVLLVGNIGPCDGCKARLKVFLYELSAQLFPKAWVTMKAVYTGDQCKRGVRGTNDRLETEYGYPDRAARQEYRSDDGTVWHPWVRVVSPWPVPQ